MYGSSAQDDGDDERARHFRRDKTVALECKRQHIVTKESASAREPQSEQTSACESCTSEEKSEIDETNEDGRRRTRSTRRRHPQRYVSVMSECVGG